MAFRLPHPLLQSNQFFTTQFWKLANIVTLPMAGRSKEAKAWRFHNVPFSNLAPKPAPMRGNIVGISFKHCERHSPWISSLWAHLARIIRAALSRILLRNPVTKLKNLLRNLLQNPFCALRNRVMKPQNSLQNPLRNPCFFAPPYPTCYETVTQPHKIPYFITAEWRA